jgi:hypothetical protein
MTSTYSGMRQADGTTCVTVNGRPLRTPELLRRGKATTFDWGYEGQGAPAHLALAILADYLDDDLARRYCAHFLRKVIRGLPSQAWVLTGADIDGALPRGGW